MQARVCLISITLFHSFSFNYFILTWPTVSRVAIFIRRGSEFILCSATCKKATASCVYFFYCKKRTRNHTVHCYSRALVELLRRPLYLIILVSRRSDSSEVIEVYPLLFFLPSSFSCNGDISSMESYQRVITIEDNPLEIYMSIQFSYIRLFLVY